MAISFSNVGSWAFSAAGPAGPSTSCSVGDMVLAYVAYKSSAIASCTASTSSSGWSKIGEFHDGTTDSGNGTGSVAIAAFWKIAESTSEAPNITFSQTVTQEGHVCIAYSKAANETWDTPVGDGGGFAAGTNVTATIQSHVSVDAGDFVDFRLASRDDCTQTVPSITQTGVTFDSVAEQPATAGSSTLGADGSYDGGYRQATAGPSSAAAVVTGTLSTSESGSAWMTRIRVIVSTERVPFVSQYPQLLAH